ncbi:hypothetical protein CYY_009616 [Polysphondylium violaceum]|uniref:BTB domain-containing protein n=1 Tax=Polysphondylium violaceum TaxID=133409 RepID=A0A8J4PL20_9MYCE|nr:hypothetical protein CYY_009616 [Polysphondylium violaceum]
MDNNKNDQQKQTTKLIEDIDLYIENLNKTYNDDLVLMKEEIQLLEEKLFIEYKKQIQDSMTSHPITLNIGGMKYQTTKETLTRIPNSYFHLMLSDDIDHRPKKHKPNTYYIERDGVSFRYVLNYLRDGKLSTASVPTSLKVDVRNELLFYKLIDTKNNLLLS